MINPGAYIQLRSLIRTPLQGSSLINTPLQRGVAPLAWPFNRFDGFHFSGCPRHAQFPNSVNANPQGLLDN
jgi:hypothetical protein